ncbi:MAG: hypothetical protein NTY86_19765 [Deltaproteobacteria bacterium]|nr:hypothetical protein [Deltaproteobacteria bacterium]
MEINIGNIAEEKSKEIAKAIIEKYDEYSYAYETHKVEKEIYARSLHEATAIFLNHGAAKFDDEVLKYLKYRLQSRLENPKDIKRATPEEMLANVIKIDVIDFLLEWDGIVI